jgi:hypothetical protein
MTSKIPGKTAKNYAATKVITRALQRSARRAREVARMHGTPIYVLKDGKIVAIKP